MIREAFRAVILANGPASAAVAGSRVYPLQVPQGTREPSLVYQRIGGVPDHTLDGPAGVRETFFQLAAWALDPDAAANLIQLAEVALNGYSGVVPVGDDSPQQTVDIRGVFLERERDGYDAAAKLYHDTRDFSVLWCPAQ